MNLVVPLRGTGGARFRIRGLRCASPTAIHIWPLRGRKQYVTKPTYHKAHIMDDEPRLFEGERYAVATLTTSSAGSAHPSTFGFSAVLRSHGRPFQWPWSHRTYCWYL